MAIRTAAPRLGEVFVTKGILSEEQVSLGLERAKAYGLRLGQTLILHDACTEEDVADALAELFGLERIDLAGFQADAALVSRVRLKNIRRLRIVPVAMRREGGRETLVIATAHPDNIAAPDELRAVLGTPVEVRVATPSAVSSLIAEIVGSDTPIPLPSLRPLHVAIHEFLCGRDSSFLLEEGAPPAIVTERRRRPRPAPPLSLARQLRQGHRRSLARCSATSRQELHQILPALLDGHQLGHLRVGQATVSTLQIPGKGRFKVTVHGMGPLDSPAGDKTHPMAVRIDRINGASNVEMQ